MTRNLDPRALLDSIRPGDWVCIVNHQGQVSRGRAVMRSAVGGWVLNMGGRYGTPALADAENIVSVRYHRCSHSMRSNSLAGDHRGGRS